MQHLPWQLLSISGISHLQPTQFLTILGSSLTKQSNYKMFKQCAAGAELGSAQPQLVLLIITFWDIRVLTQDQFKVLKVSNVPFPRSSAYPATITTSFGEDVTDFTVCYRIFLDSYDDGIFLPVKHSHYSEWFEGPGSSAGWGTEGYNGGVKEFTYPWGLLQDLLKRGSPTITISTLQTTYRSLPGTTSVAPTALILKSCT